MPAEPFAEFCNVFANIPEYTYYKANKLPGIENILYTVSDRLNMHPQ